MMMKKMKKKKEEKIHMKIKVIKEIIKNQEKE